MGVVLFGFAIDDDVVPSGDAQLDLDVKNLADLPLAVRLVNGHPAADDAIVELLQTLHFLTDALFNRGGRVHAAKRDLDNGLLVLPFHRSNLR